MNNEMVKENTTVENKGIDTTGATVVEKKFWEAIDLGRSGVRMFGKLDNVYRVFSSDFIEIDKDTDTRKDGGVYDDFIINKAPKETIVGRRFVKGEGINSYHATTHRADNTDLKVNQDANYINFAYAIATNILMKGFSTATTDIRTGICIPSAEYFSESGKEMKHRLCGVYEVKFPILEKTVIFKIKPEQLAIMPEGVVAFYPLTKTKNKVMVMGNVVVVVDVGHGSTDVTIAVKGKPSGNSSRSFNIGGVTIQANVARFLEEKGFGASKGNIMSAIQNGWVKQGLVCVDVSDLVVKAKEMFAQLLVEKIKEVLTASGMTPSEVGYFYFVGRSFLPSKFTGDKYNTQDLRDLTIKEWPIKDVAKLDLVEPIQSEAMLKEIRIDIPTEEVAMYPTEEVKIDQETGSHYIMRKMLTTLEGNEVIPAEVANVTGVSLLLR